MEKNRINTGKFHDNYRDALESLESLEGLET
jgi:hypothetical protein